MTRIVGLIGAAGSGKSEAANTLEEAGFKRLRFSAPLKNMLRAYFETCGLSPDEIERRIEGDLKETPDELLGDQTPRYAMQTLGTEWGRALICEDIWSKAWRAGAEAAIAEGYRIVAEDVRFDTEEFEVRRLGGQIVEIKGRAKEAVAKGGHASEAMERLTSDLTLVNDGTLPEFWGKVKYVLTYQPETCAALAGEQ